MSVGSSLRKLEGDFMLINYWDCKFSDAEEYFSEDDYFWVYDCRHPSNPSVCVLDVSCMYGSEKCECKLLDEDLTKN